MKIVWKFLKKKNNNKKLEIELPAIPLLDTYAKNNEIIISKRSGIPMITAALLASPKI
jgi:hypothetical protein